MPPDVIAVLEPALRSGPVACILLAAVWWLTRGNEKLVTALNEERKERLDGLTQQVDKLERKSEECEKDRLNLHKLLIEVRHETGT
jgi:hypothetical protein